METTGIENGRDLDSEVHAPGSGTRWKPGQSGNRSGRPKKLPITDVLREELEHIGADGVAHDVAIARKLVEMARQGDLGAIREIADRTEGKARHRVEQEPSEGDGAPTCLIIDL
jgi:Family of unknown function (DUF5681)